jgi:hypothetical protein
MNNAFSLCKYVSFYQISLLTIGVMIHGKKKSFIRVELVFFDSLLSGVFPFLQCNFHFSEIVLDKSMQDMKL